MIYRFYFLFSFLILTIGFANHQVAFSQETMISHQDGIESEITIAINPNNDDQLVVAAMNLGGSNQACLIFFSENAGQTWQQSTQSMGMADPVLAYGDNGRVQMAYLDFGSTLEVNLATSTNNGQTWATQTLALDGLAVDRPWIQIDNTLSSPYYGRTFMAYYHPESPSGIHFVAVEEDGTVGVNHAVHASPFLHTQNPALSVDSSGVTTVCFLAKDNQSGFGIQTAISIDGGATFAPGAKVTDINMFDQNNNPVTNVVGFGPGDSSRLGISLQMAVDNSGGSFDGRLYLTWTDFSQGDPQDGMDIYLSFSDDHGTAWSAPTIVNDDGVESTHQYYSGIDVNDQGVLSLCWYDRRSDAVNDALTDIYFTYSSDGAATFYPNVKLNSVSSDHTAITTGMTTFGVGEYTGITSSSSFAYPVWADGRNNDGEMDVYLAKVSLETVVSVDEVRLITGIRLLEAKPNPATDHTVVDFYLSEAGPTKLEVFDLAGHRVKSLVREFREAGNHSVFFRSSDLPSGLYFCRLEFGRQTDTRKLVLVR